jgi:hypothetical protein
MLYNFKIGAKDTKITVKIENVLQFLIKTNNFLKIEILMIQAHK